jgi:Tol biopolymer transport system component
MDTPISMISLILPSSSNRRVAAATAQPVSGRSPGVSRAGGRARHGGRFALLRRLPAMMRDPEAGWRRRALFLFAIPLCLASSGRAAGAFDTGLQIDYFGQNPPGDTPGLFAPDLISKPDAIVQNCCFSADGREFVYVVTDSTWSKSTVMYTRFADGKWTNPAPLDLGRISAYTPYFSPDGATLYFTSRIEDGRKLGHIFASRRDGGAWKPAVQLPAPVNSETMEWEVCITPDRTLYFSSGRPGGYGNLDIYRARLVDGKYSIVESLSAPINGVSSDECPYMAPDESFLVFNCWKYNAKFKGNNLYVSFKQAGGGWSEPVALEAGVNTDELDIYPYVTPDGKYLMFTRREFAEVARFSRLYWVNASVLDRARKQLAAQPSAPAAEPAGALEKYLGTYAADQWKLTIGKTRTLAGEVLTFQRPGDAGTPQILEHYGKDEFWIPAARFLFDPEAGRLRIHTDRPGDPEHVFQKIP